MRRLLCCLLLVLACAAPAHADLQSAVGHFGIGTGAVSSTVSVSSLSFQPKVVIFFWNGRTDSTDAISAVDVRPGMCFAVSSSDQKNLTGYSRQNVATSVTGISKRDDSCVDVLSSASAYDGRASFTSMNADGFTLTIQDQFTADYRVGYLALGGSDITNVATGHGTTGTAETRAITGVGFQPDTLLLFSHGDSSTTTSGITTGLAMSFGATDGVTSATCAITSQDAVTTPNTSRYCRTGDLYLAVSHSQTIRSRGSLGSFDSDGFTLSLATTTSSRYFGFLAIKGAKFFVGDLLTQTNTSTDIVESGFGFSPEALLVASHTTSANAAGSVSAHNELSIGAATSPTSRLSVCWLDEDKASASNTDVATAVEFDELYCNVSTASALEGLMDYKTKDGDGATFIMDDADPAQAYGWFWAIGPTGGAPPSCSGRRTLLGVGKC